MAVPKKRKSKISRNMRRSHDAKSGLKLTICPNCKQLRPPHAACPHCGTYKGRTALDMQKKAAKQERRAKTKRREQSGQ